MVTVSTYAGAKIAILLHSITSQNIIIEYMWVITMQFRRIRDLREDNDLTQTQVAEFLGVKQTTYSKYELGKILVPIDILIQLCEFYHVSLDYLVGRSDRR